MNQILIFTISILFRCWLYKFDAFIHHYELSIIVIKVYKLIILNFCEAEKICQKKKRSDYISKRKIRKN